MLHRHRQGYASFVESPSTRLVPLQMLLDVDLLEQNDLRFVIKRKKDGVGFK